MGRERRNRDRLGALRRAVREHGPQQDHHHHPDVGGSLAGRRNQPVRTAEHGPDSAVDVRAQVRATAVDLDRRAGLHRPGQLPRLESQRPEQPGRRRRGDGALPLFLHRGRIGISGRGPGSRTEAEHPACHCPGNRSCSCCLPAVTGDRVRRRTELRAGRIDRSVRGGGDRHDRCIVGRRGRGRAGRDLRVRCAQRMDDAVRPDAAGSGPGRSVPRTLQSAVESWSSGVRDRDVGTAGPRRW